jgi:hypothetical protein
LAMSLYGDLDISVIDSHWEENRYKPYIRFDSISLEVWKFIKDEGYWAVRFILFIRSFRIWGKSFKDLMDGYESIHEIFLCLNTPFLSYMAK